MSPASPAAVELSFLDALGDPVMITDPEGTILQVNRSFEVMTGYARAEVAGRKPNLLKSGVHSPGFYRELWAKVSGGAVWRGTITNRRKDGTLYQCEETISPLRGADGRIAGYVAVERDISERLALEGERRKAADAAARSDGLLKAVFQAMPIGVRVIDAAGDLVYVNPEARRIIGGDDAIRGGVVRLRGVWSDGSGPVHADDWPLVRAWRTGRPQLYRSIVLSALDGVERRILVSSYPLVKADGAVENAFSFIQDITELEEVRRALSIAETSLQRAGRLEVIGRLAAGVSHDFNNALSIINGFAEFVQRALPPGHPALCDVGEIVKAVGRAKAQTGQLLAFGRQQTLRPQAVPVAALFEGLARLLKGFLGVHVLVEARAECGPGRSVWVDPAQLENAVINLALNARDAMPQGGSLLLRAVEGGTPAGGGERPCVTISVTDSGTGVPAEVLPRIFEPFFTTKAPGKGTGLGLATVYGFARQSGGDLQVENVPEGGARFSLILPACDGREVPVLAPAAEAEPPRSTRREKVVIVDDESAVLEIARRILTGAGYEVVQFDDPAAAAAARPAVFKGAVLLVADVRMPALSGPRLAELLTAAHPGLKVLYMSGYLESVLAEEAGGSAPDGPFLHKPFSRRELLTAARAAIDGPRGRHDAI